MQMLDAPHPSQRDVLPGRILALGLECGWLVGNDPRHRRPLNDFDQFIHGGWAERAADLGWNTLACSERARWTT
jgi:hypothetical protein